MLNSIYSQFDATITASDAYKVETAGDSYLVVSGVPTENGDKHADTLATIAIVMLEVTSLNWLRCNIALVDCVHNRIAASNRGASAASHRFAQRHRSRWCHWSSGAPLLHLRRYGNWHAKETSYKISRHLGKHSGAHGKHKHADAHSSN